MGIIAAIVSAVLYTLLNCSVSFVPAYVSQSMGKVFTSAINNMLVVMQVLYLIAALDNGVITGCWGIVLGSIAYLVTGNATPGLILGILTGKTIELNGVKYNGITTIGGTCSLNEMVRVMIPQGQYNNMFILKGGSGSGGTVTPTPSVSGVSSVNGKTGDVILDSDDVGAVSTSAQETIDIDFSTYFS